MTIEIQDQVHRTISYDSLTHEQESDCPLAVACENASVENWNEYCSIGHRFTIIGTKEEVEQKTLDLMTNIENLALCTVISIKDDKEVERGFDFNEYKEYESRQYEITFGRHKIDVAGRIYGALPKNITTYYDENVDVELIVFFNTEDDVFEGMSEEDKEIYREDHPFNHAALRYGIDGAYGDIAIFHPEEIGKYIDLSVLEDLDEDEE